MGVEKAEQNKLKPGAEVHKIPQQCLFSNTNIHTQNLKYITALDKRKKMKKNENAHQKSVYIRVRVAEENYNCKK